MAKALEDLARLVSVADSAEYLGLKEGQLRGLISAGRIARVRIGSRVLIPRDALDQFILANTELPCRDEIQERAFASSKSADAITSSGRTVDAAASAQRALRTAESLKPRSPTSSISAPEMQARVIPLRS
ncbi:helix-turn-helix domain-containing protein [Tardiphaga sp. 71_E8_N1_1]|uniref:helix-turn-helix domain-containing protein n=1 Tax=Tardiphaga sp. 71_E8_N1_1 TaxID=3240784 RepID=UPI003F8CAF24